DGHRFTGKQRTAGPTLLWTVGGGSAEGSGAAPDGVTLRLEGVASKARALEIARSLEAARSLEPGGARDGAGDGAGDDGALGARPGLASYAAVWLCCTVAL